jgi:LCP family protein required for cell wall assembly
MSPQREDGRGGQRLEKKHKKPKREDSPMARKARIRRRILILVTIIAFLFAVGFVAYKLMVVKPEIEIPAAEDNTQTDSTTLNSEAPHLSGDRKEDFYTFLIIGRDTGGGGNTDTILLASYDVPNQKLNVMSIPRDTMVNVPWDIKKINSVYNYYGCGDKGINALDEEISQLVGFKPDFQVTVEWEAVGQLVEAIGGVYYDVPRDMDYDDPTQNLHIHVKKGYQKLDGETAMGVVRFRDGRNGYNDGDLGRIKTQQGFLKAVVEQCLQINKIAKISEFSKIFTENVTTNFTINNLAWFAQQAIFGGLKMENVNFVTMPCTGASVWSRSIGQNLSYVVPITDDLVDLVNEDFNPYQEKLESNELDIMSVDKNGKIYSSSGTVEDTKANSHSSSSSSSSGKTTSTPSTSASPTKNPPETQEPKESESVTTEEPVESGSVPTEEPAESKSVPTEEPAESEPVATEGPTESEPIITVEPEPSTGMTTEPASPTETPPEGIPID